LWVVPFLATIAYLVIFLFVQFRIAPFSEQMKEAQRTAIQKMVNDGKLTSEQGGMAIQQSENMGGLQLAIGLVAGTIVLAIFFFAGAAILFLVAKFALKAPIGYGKTLEFYGISSWIGLIGGVVTLLLMFALGTMYARPSASLAVLSSFNPTLTLHKYLMAFDVFAIWQTAVIGVALSKVSGKSTGLCLGITFALWILYVVVRIALGLSS
jgi:hypothetical protein